MEQRHIIRKQVIEFQLRDAAESFALQQEMARIYNEDIVPLIGAFLDAYSFPGAVHRIERLELDLGRLDRSDLRASFIREAERQLEEQLPVLLEIAEKRRQDDQRIAVLSGTAGQEQAAALPITTADAHFSANAHSGEEQTTAADSTPETFGQAAEKTAVPQDKTGSALDLLAHYVQTGRFPWWSNTASYDAFAALVTELLTADRNLSRQRLRPLLAQLLTERYAAVRLVHAFDDVLLHRIVHTYMPGKPAALKRLHKAWKALPENGDAETARLNWWQPVLEHAFSGRKPLEIVGKFVADRTFIPLSDGISAFALHELVPAERSVRALIATHTKTGKPIAPAAETTVWEQMNQAFTTLAEQEEKTTTHLPKTNMTQIEQQFTAFSTSEKTDVGNAGLVLLWPFLGTLFERLELTEEQHWKNAACADKACAALQYLATGKATGRLLEAALPLNKVLCGIPLQQPVQLNVKLAKKEQQLCDELLKAVINHNQQFGSMTVDGLRGSFLLRNGLLSERDGNPLLQVEHKAYDVLLTSVPWSFSHVKLPWMQHLLTVEWYNS